ncbi:hypothetical protein VPH35_054245 [Triticum aestivum]
MAAPTRGHPGLGGLARKATMTITVRQGGGVVAAAAMLARGRQRSGQSCDGGLEPAGSGEEGHGMMHADKREWRFVRSAMEVPQAAAREFAGDAVHKGAAAALVATGTTPTSKEAAQLLWSARAPTMPPRFYVAQRPNSAAYEPCRHLPFASFISIWYESAGC